MLKHLALSLIHAYQRWISPHKGFACAHRVHLGGPSCSKVGARLIRRFGLRKGLPVLRLRLQRCGDMHRLHHPRWTRPLAAQRGDCDLPCDLPCDGGDAPSGRSAWRCLGNCADCGCSPCDLLDFNRKKRDKEPSRSKRRVPAARP